MIHGTRWVAEIFVTKMQARGVGHDAVRSPMSTADMLGAEYTFFSRWGDVFTLLSTRYTRERRVGPFVKVVFLNFGFRAQEEQQ